MVVAVVFRMLPHSTVFDLRLDPKAVYITSDVIPGTNRIRFRSFAGRLDLLALRDSIVHGDGVDLRAAGVELILKHVDFMMQGPEPQTNVTLYDFALYLASVKSSQWFLRQLVHIVAHHVERFVDGAFIGDAPSPSSPPDWHPVACKVN